MKTLKLFVLLIPAFGFIPIFAGGPKPAKIEYGTYVNQRYEFEMKYPKELLFPTDPSNNNDGRGFVSKDGQVDIGNQGKHLVVNTWEEEYQSWLDMYKDGKITHKTINKKTFAFSGVKDDQVFYQKALWIGPEDNPVIWRFSASYPEKEKKLWEPIVAFCAKSMKPAKSSKPVLWNRYSGLGPNGDEFK